MTVDNSVLFQPLDTGRLYVKNRIVCPPMATIRDLAGPDGVRWYGRLAEGGAGTIIVEGTPVTRFGKEWTATSLRPLVDAIHAHGAHACVQLFPVPFEKSPADLKPRGPADMTTDEIAKMIQQFARAAVVSRDVGFDSVEPHGAHGYVFNQFFSPEKNARTDDYGGDLDSRMRLGIEIVEAIREAVGDGLILFYRHTPKGPGYGLEESLQFTKRLVEAGVEVMDVSPSSEEAPGDVAAHFKAELPVPVITVGELSRDGRAAEALDAQRADLVAIGRQLIADAFWPEKVRTDKLDEIIECTRCNKMCFGHLKKGLPIACTQWPDQQ